MTMRWRSWLCGLVLVCGVVSEVHAGRWTSWSTPPEYRRTRVPTATWTPTRTRTATRTPTPTRTRTGGPTATPTYSDGHCYLPSAWPMGRLSEARPDLVGLYYAIRECLDAPEYLQPPRRPTPGWEHKWVTPDTIYLEELPAVECPQTPGLWCCIDAYPPWWDGTTWRKAKATMSATCSRQYITLLPRTCTWADGTPWAPGQTMWGHELQHILSDEWAQRGRPPVYHESGWRPECELPADYEGEGYYP